MTLYDEACFECSKLITRKYSTSFSQGISAFHKRFRYPIYAIYGFVRYADEIVDTFHDSDQEQLLCDFKQQVFKAIDQKISLNPILHSFQLVVNQYRISNELIEAFLASMAIDLKKKSFSQKEYEDYIHGSAEAIGLMCLKIFCEGNTEQYNKLASLAKSLGSALQKINFLRDIKADHLERGRVYFPGVDFNNFSDEQKKSIEDDIRIDMARGYTGISQLPESARLGVYIAYTYYDQLFHKICKASVDDLQGKRIRVPNARKTLLYLQSRLKFSFGIL